MHSSPDIIGNYETALANAEKGFVSIPCHPGTKVPMVTWKRWQDEAPPTELLREWFRDHRANIAILTQGMVLIDIDDPAFLDLAVRHCGDTPYKVRTPRGGTHLGYRARKGVAVRNQVKVKGHPIDIRTNGGLALIPPSRTGDGEYAWLGDGLRAISELPVARIGWTRERRRRQMKTAVAAEGDPHGLLWRGRKYVDAFDRAVSGESGHRTTFVSALKIATFAARDPELTWQLLLYYNATKCDPEWSERELRHKWEDALKGAK